MPEQVSSSSNSLKAPSPVHIGNRAQLLKVNTCKKLQYHTKVLPGTPSDIPEEIPQTDQLKRFALLHNSCKLMLFLSLTHPQTTKNSTQTPTVALYLQVEKEKNGENDKGEEAPGGPLAYPTRS